MTSPWIPVDGVEGAWTLERREDGVSTLRCVAVRLVDDALVLVSPIGGAGGDALDALRGLGRPAFLLAPNHFHHLGLPSWSARLAPIAAVASDGARPRLARRTTVPVGPLDPLRAALPAHVELLEPPGLRSGETWLSIRGPEGTAWVVGDAFFHFPRVPRTANGAILVAIRAGPGLRLGCSFKALQVRDRRAYGAWLRARLATDPPAVLVPAHGEILRGPDVADRLRAEVARALPG